MQISHYELQKKQQNQSTKNILNEKETDELTICGVGRSCSKSNTALTETNKTKRLTQLKSNNDILMIY